jgi:two-component system sensor histidine kinase YesM
MGRMIDPSMKRRFFLRNLGLFLILLFLPLLIMGGVSVHILQGHIRGDLETDTFFSLRQIAATVDLVLDELEPLQLAFGMDGQSSYISKKLLNSRELDYTDITLLANISGQLSSLINARSYIHSIYIHFDNPSGYFLSNTGKELLDRHPDGKWLEGCIGEVGGGATWSVRRSMELTGASSQDVVSIIHRSGNPGSLVVFNLLPRYIEKTTIGALSGTGHAAVVLNDEGTVLFGESEYLTEDVKARLLQETGQRAEETFTIGEKRGRIIVHALRSENGFMYALFSSEAAVFGPYNRLLSITLGMLALSVVSGIVLALIFTERRTRQVYNVVRILQAAEAGEPLPPPSNDGVSTFGYIVDNIINGFIRQTYLQTQLEAKKYKLKAAQLMALQAQLNPHFLFNTLETMNWNAYRMSRKATLVNDMIENLSLLLRYSLAPPDEPVTLEEEIHHVEYYLCIQGYRYRDKFDTEWSVAEDCLAAEVPRLCLQPIIENALYHGIKPSRGRAGSG